MSFEEAQYVFADPERIERLDQSKGNASGETRWQTLGMIGKVLFVVYTERLANKAERRSYNGYYFIDNKGWTKTT
ncbi:MAG: BrnT family toxin [Spirochaetaceae bacterium]|nr:BrnT family toxin [Spirochaetaceae bacterium]